MFNFSSKTFVNKEYKVSDFLKQIDADREVKTDSKIVKRILFQNVINSSTINVDENPKYKNIYVIRMSLSEERIPRMFVEALDKVINFHTYFLFENEDKTASLIAYKEITKQVKVDKYYGHGFEKESLIELPRINSVADVYKEILAYEIGLKARKEESPSEFITRVKAINKLEFQIFKTEKGIQWETQPRKKFEYNERLRRYKAEYNDLTRAEE